jgi:formate C-acetyltransferase
MTTTQKTAAETKTLDYLDRIAMLKEHKNQQTLDKVRRMGPLDVDDHGYVLPPEDFTWEPIPNHPNGGFYGFNGWSENFSSLLAALPPYIDPADMLAGRYRMFLYWKRDGRWPPELEFPQLRALHEKYGIISGIEGANHFAPDYRIGLELGWNGILEKIRRYRSQHGPENRDFYDAEEKVALAIQNWIRRHVEAAREALAVESRPELRQNLREMIEVNEWVAENPPARCAKPCSGSPGSTWPRAPTAATVPAASSTPCYCRTTSATSPPAASPTRTPSC